MKEDAATLNDAGRLSMIAGYRKQASDEEGALSDFKTAEERFLRAHALDADDPHILLNIADSLCAQGRFDEARPYYRRAVDGLDPGSDHLAGFKNRWGGRLPPG